MQNKQEAAKLYRLKLKNKRLKEEQELLNLQLSFLDKVEIYITQAKIKHEY